MGSAGRRERAGQDRLAKDYRSHGLMDSVVDVKDGGLCHASST